MSKSAVAKNPPGEQYLGVEAPKDFLHPLFFHYSLLGMPSSSAPNFTCVRLSMIPWNQENRRPEAEYYCLWLVCINKAVGSTS